MYNTVGSEMRNRCRQSRPTHYVFILCASCKGHLKAVPHFEINRTILNVINCFLYGSWKLLVDVLINYFFKNIFTMPLSLTGMELSEFRIIAVGYRQGIERLALKGYEKLPSALVAAEISLSRFLVTGIQYLYVLLSLFVGYCVSSQSWWWD